MVVAQWHGTRAESEALLAAIRAHCTCQFGVLGVRLSTCPPHQMMVEDQRALDGLVYARRMRARLWADEMRDDANR